MAVSTLSATQPFSVTFEVPGAVANMGVYAAIFGNEQNDMSQFVYLTQTGVTASTTTLSTATASAVGPVDGNPIPVTSVTGFPPSGNILISQPGLSVTVAYTGVDTKNNAFTGTTFPPGASGIGSGATVTSSNVLGSTINVASTAGFPSSGALMIETPAGYTPSQNVVVYYTATTPDSFVGVTGYIGSPALPGGGAVIQMPEPASGMSYADVPFGQNLPLINLFPASIPPYPNATVSATLSLPDPSANGILSGVMVISVGSPIAIPVLGSAASPSVGSPTPMTNPNDVFGLFEWGITSTSLDFDVSEVDQVGFPFQVTTTGATPPPPADSVLGVGMLPDRETLFKGFKSFIDKLDSASNATLFLAGAADNQNAPFPTGTRITAPQDIIGVLEGNPPLALSANPAGAVGNYTSVTAYYAVTATSATGESMASNILTGTTGAAYNQLQIAWNPYPYATGYNVYWSLSSDLSGAQLIATGLTATSYLDASPGSHAGTVQTPPINNYLYDPLNKYFEAAIKDFFDYYRPADPASPTTTFVLDDQATQTKWSGYTLDVYASGNAGPQYTMLQLTGGAGQWGDQFAGKILNVYQPFFSSNTVNPAYPPAPSWLTAIYSAWESASSMVFGADGVFGSVVDSASTLDVGDAKNVYNNIVSALNRGITPRNAGGNWVNVLPPSYWASSPLLTSASAAAAAGSLAAGSYRYAITAVNIDATPLAGAVKNASDADPIVITSPSHGLQTGDRVIIAGVSGNTNANGTFPASVIDANTFSIPVAGNGTFTGSAGAWQQATETTPSNLIQVDVASDQNTVALAWAAINGPGGAVGAETAGGFNIYRSQRVNGVWSALQKLNSSPIANNSVTPVATFTDDGSYTAQGQPPFVYYANGQSANFYAAYFSQLDVSINGLGYGFPYADKNGQSTNVQMSFPGPTSLKIKLLPWVSGGGA
ncbi:MAG: hypothetical protein ACYC2R_16385 [Burkholderiales bacterium]